MHGSGELLLVHHHSLAHNNSDIHSGRQPHINPLALHTGGGTRSLLHASTHVLATEELAAR